MKRKSLLSCALAGVLAVAMGSGTARAAEITFAGEFILFGSGFGNMEEILTLHQQPQTNVESGSVLWDGTQDVYTGDARTQSQFSKTLTVEELTNLGIDADTFAVLFNLNETGVDPAAIIQGFQLVFQDASGAVLFTAAYVPANIDEATLVPLHSQGTGTSDWMYLVSFTEAEADLFFGDPTNRVGMIVDPVILSVDAGPDVFHVFAIPVPAALPAGLALMGLIGMKRRSWRR